MGSAGGSRPRGELDIIWKRLDWVESHLERLLRRASVEESEFYDLYCLASERQRRDQAQVTLPRRQYIVSAVALVVAILSCLITFTLSIIAILLQLLQRSPVVPPAG